MTIAAPARRCTAPYCRCEDPCDERQREPCPACDSAGECDCYREPDDTTDTEDER